MGALKARLLVAVDGSEPAFEAVRYVSRVFPPDRVQVVLFHVMSSAPEGFWAVERNPASKRRLAAGGAWAARQEGALQDYMERARQLLLSRGVPQESVSVTIKQAELGIARDITREAQNKYEAVVVGRWGVGKLKALVWGSIASKLAGHLTHTPLWVVGDNPPTGKLLLAMDASQEAMNTVDYVGTMMAGTGWKVTLFHVMRGFDFAPIGNGETLAPSEEIDGIENFREELQKSQEAMEALLEKASRKLHGAGLNPDRVTTKIITGATSRAKAIIEEASTGGYGTIAVGRRGLSRVEEFLMGRVSNKVMQMAREMAVWVVS